MVDVVVVVVVVDVVEVELELLDEAELVVCLSTVNVHPEVIVWPSDSIWHS